MKKFSFILAKVSHHTEHSKIIAFTLAEVLITLGIIGVVAALTMPSLITHHKKRAKVTAIKKVQSVMGQAVNMLALENGGTLAGLCDADESHDCFAEKLLPYLKKAKYCSADSNENKYCYGWQNSDDSDGKWHRPHIILSDGIALEIYHSDKDCVGTSLPPYKTGTKHCASFYADINGLKGPNIRGKDVFGFTILPNQVVPWGSPTIFEERFIPTAETCEKGNGQNLEYCTYYYLY